MKVVSVDRPTNFIEQVLHPHLAYLMFDAAAQRLIQEAPGRLVKVAKEPPDIPWWDGKRKVNRMLVFGGGGMGDRIQSTPALRKLANLLGMKIDVANSRAPEWDHIPYIGTRHPWMLPPNVVKNYDACCTLEDVLGQEDEKTVHLAELIARRLFVAPLYPGAVMGNPGEYTCDWYWQTGEDETLTWSPEKAPDTLWVGIQVASHGKSRTWPMENVIALAQKLSATRKYNIVVLLLGTYQQSPAWGAPGDIDMAGLPEGPYPNVSNLCGRITGTRQLAALISRLDLLIAPDSGPLHLAGVLGIPSIGLYGPHLHETRGLWFPNQHPITGTVNDDPMCPCFCHCDQGAKGVLPCGRDVCACMALISANAVFAKAIGFLDAAIEDGQKRMTTCPICQKVFKSMAGRDQHLRRQHKAPEQE